MTSEIEALKTNEFHRRRKLRIQQVREQSKDIAKKIRQRAKVEKWRRIGELDARKEQEYLQHQENFVKRLEEVYVKGLEKVGASHKLASEVNLHGDISEKTDLSKVRGKEATTELRRRKQEKLDEQKKLLDRKVLAREAANEISREKSSALSNKLLTKSSSNNVGEATSKVDVATATTTENKENNIPDDGDKPEIVTSDMATQWDFEEVPNEWEPHIPKLSLPKDDRDSIKESNSRTTDNKGERNKRINLFALSSEMPSSLRGGLSSVPEEQAPSKSSLTLVSEYLQNRGMRLREFNAPSTSKKPAEDLSSIKQTIMRTRASKEVSAKGSPLKSTKSSEPECALSKKNSVMIYNHSTRDSRDMPCGDKRHVVRDQQSNEDAYSQAIKEVSSENIKDKEHQKKLQEMRNKIAMTKQNVEKEYKDTMAFLSSLPKDSRPIKKAYMDEQRQQSQKDNRQRKLQYEYKKIEKEIRRNPHKLSKPGTHDKRCRKSKSPGDLGSDEDFNAKDFQYSWMPVPESDGNLAIHTIPTSMKEKSGNSVKFNKVDSYHEYRSRHKHTPPTKDTSSQDKPVKRTIETIVLEQSEDDSTNCSSISADTSSVENLQLDNEATGRNNDINLSNAERIIIYKILEKKCKKSKTVKEAAKSVGSLNTEGLNKSVSKDLNKQKMPQSVQHLSKNAETRVSFEQLNEGVYKTVNEKGDNITSMYFTDSQGGPLRPGEAETRKPEEDETQHGQTCSCSKKLSRDVQSNAGTNVDWRRGDESATSMRSKINQCKCTSTDTDLRVHPSAASTASFKTATNIKTTDAPDDGFIKLLDEGGHEAGKFYIGASGLLNNDAYEVVIQLRKKDGAKDDQRRETDIPLVTPCYIQQTEAPKEVIQQSEDIQEQPPSETAPKANLIVDPQSSKPDNVDSSKPDALSRNKQLVSSSVNKDNIPSEEPVGDTNDFANKGTSQLTYGVPDNVEKTNIEPRPATSTHTQTTPSSPRQRPVFFHMSSSTSTAYMSPPEFVLPKFLKHNYKLNYEEINDPTQNSILEDVGVEIINKEEFCEEFEGCQCRRCTHAKKITLTKIKRPVPSYREKTRSNNMQTPPNSTRSYGNAYQCNSSDADSKKNSVRPAKTTAKKKKNTCRNCETRAGSKTCVKNHPPISKRNIPASRKSSRNCVMRVNAVPYKNKSVYLRNENNSGKPNLNPIVKSYVDKLLALNKEGLKALEVVNQDCSSVTTPGSSIIEIHRNIDNNVPEIDTKISLEQIKDLLTQQILEKYENDSKRKVRKASVSTESNNGRKYPRLPKKKSMHKVKSLNISKNLFNTNTNASESSKCSKVYTSPPSKKAVPISNRTNSRSKSSPSPRRVSLQNNTKCAEKINNLMSDRAGSSINTTKRPERQERAESLRQSLSRATTSESESNGFLLQHKKLHPLSNISTQTSRTIDEEINFMKLAEDKLQNMEKIADLTEKCTIRLSNLAKVLEEVRRNKSLAYSQISDSASDSDRKSDKVSTNDKPTKAYDSPCTINVELKKRIQPPPPTPNTEANDMRESQCSFLSELIHGKRNRSTDCNSNAVSTDSDVKSDRSANNRNSSPVYDPIEPNNANFPSKETCIEDIDKPGSDLTDFSKYTPFLNDIPKPDVFRSPATPAESPATNDKSVMRLSSIDSVDQPNTKRGKPPPALSRMSLKHGRDMIVPHELSTVIEVDSPMSAKFKNQSTQNENETKCDDQVPETKSQSCDKEPSEDEKNIQHDKDQYVNPDLLQSNLSLSRRQTKMSTDSSDDSKLQMMDLNKFNEIMLKPFISIREYAKQCNVESLDEGSNLDDIPRDDVINDELSSLHSDASLPDVIAELLKRKIIAEPFKFDTVSNVNSTTVSSESTISMLALSKVRKAKKKASVVFQSKENAAETSDTLSVSSNPDLENAFKKLGMGWASSTLKKTKERLALSSSSNTSSSSLAQFKVPSVPALGTDSASSALRMSNKSLQGNIANECSVNVEQQTSMAKSMTVKEFLTNELAKKITFTNKSYRNDTEEEFVSLFETKMPVDTKNSSPVLRDERSMDSAPSASNRARTSTPVQIFKSMTYRSSSSSNMSNGLFSNADDLSSVKGTSNSIRNHSTSDKDDLTIPNYSLRMRKDLSDCSKSD